MTANRVSLANLARCHRQEWITLARQTVAIVVAFWFVVKVVPVLAEVRVSLGDDGFDSAAFFNTVSDIATLCGMWLLPLFLVAHIAAGILPESRGGEQWRRRGKLAFNGFLVAAILLPTIGFAIPLLRFWIASSP